LFPWVPSPWWAAVAVPPVNPAGNARGFDDVEAVFALVMKFTLVGHTRPSYCWHY
jgi:hypothetical protein